MIKRCLSFVCLLIVLFTFFGCQNIIGENQSKSTDTYSSSFKSKEERIEFLKKYMSMPTDIDNTAYHIIYHDNSKGYAVGPSDWNIKVIIELEPDLIDLWIDDDMEQVKSDDVDILWWGEILPDDMCVSEKEDSFEYYKRKDSKSYLVVNREDGIIFKYFYTD